MSELHLNESLLELYEKNWSGYIENIRKKTFSAFPFLLWPKPGYAEAPVRIMICGQETQGWGNELDGEDPSSITPRRIAGIYNGFVNEGGYNSPYWNFSNKIAKALPNVGFVHNNIVKIGRREGAGCDEDIFTLSKKYFPVVREEITFLKPDLIIFFTGSSYDTRIGEVLGEFSSESIAEDRYIERVTFRDTTLPPAIKTYHPGYIQRNGWYWDYSEAIIAEIKKILPNAGK